MMSPLSHLIIGHDNSGFGPGWFLERIDVECPTIGMTQVFPCNRWLAKDEDDHKIERILNEDTSLRITKEPKIPWYFWIYTSDIANSGTDAHVTMVMYGDKGKTDEVELKSKKDLFERGKCDEIKIELEDVGQPFKVRIQHDNSGKAPGWHLDRIEGENMITKVKFIFPCRRWLATDEDDRSIIRELPAEGKHIKSLPLVKYQVEVMTGDKRGAGTGKFLTELHFLKLSHDFLI
jgi:lipoxygenase homology domain-containing protein 1